MGTKDRSYLKFTEKVRKAFAFLTEQGFNEIEALPTIVRYQKGGVEVDVYHGRQSNEIGLGVTAFGTRYTISEIIRATDPKTAKQFHYVATTSPEGVISALDELSKLTKQYGRDAIEGDAEFFTVLERQRSLWAEEYAIDVLAEQLRPQADEAFRRKDYLKAAELYSRIRTCLSPSEIKKLNLAEERLRER